MSLQYWVVAVGVGAALVATIGAVAVERGYCFYVGRLRAVSYIVYAPRQTLTVTTSTLVARRVAVSGQYYPDIDNKGNSKMVDTTTSHAAAGAAVGAARAHHLAAQSRMALIASMSRLASCCLYIAASTDTAGGAATPSRTSRPLRFIRPPSPPIGSLIEVAND